MTTLNAVWPLFGLRLATPRLELRPIQDEDIPAAVEAALSGIHQAGRNPFSTPWTELPAEEVGPKMARWYWRCRAECSPESWTLLLGIWHDGEFIGCQDVGAKDFALLKTVTTGSWLKQSVQGRGKLAQVILRNCAAASWPSTCNSQSGRLKESGVRRTCWTVSTWVPQAFLVMPLGS